MAATLFPAARVLIPLLFHFEVYIRVVLWFVKLVLWKRLDEFQLLVVVLFVVEVFDHLEVYIRIGLGVVKLLLVKLILVSQAVRQQTAVKEQFVLVKSVLVKQQLVLVKQHLVLVK